MRKKIYKGLSCIFMMSIMISQSVIGAENTSQTRKSSSYTEMSVEELSTEEGQKKVAEMTVETHSLPKWPEGPKTYGEAAILMEADTGAILYAKNIDARFYPASITKLLTSLVALKNGKMDDKVTFSYDSLSFLEPGDAYIGMKEGNVITLEQALHAVLLASANEVSYATGESVGKNLGEDYNWFIREMNRECNEIGAFNSHFSNTNGLHSDDHYTTARDMALISKELFKYPKAFEIMQTEDYKIPASKTTEEHVFQQNHKMLLSWHEKYYDKAIGGKTGYTDQSLSTLVTMADNGELKLICVLLRTLNVNNVYPDTANLFEYGFNNFKKINMGNLKMPEEVKEINGGTPMWAVVPNTVSPEELQLKLTEEKNDTRKGTLTCVYHGSTLGKAEVALKNKKAEVRKEEEQKKEAQRIKNNNRMKKAIPIFVAIVGILGGVYLKFYTDIKRKRSRQRRKKKRQEERR